MRTDAPLVADVAYGTDDLIAAVNQLLTPAVRAKISQRADEVRAFSEKARQLRAQAKMPRLHRVSDESGSLQSSACAMAQADSLSAAAPPPGAGD